MGKITKQALMYAENLALPSYQVIMISTTQGCRFCQRRVSRIVSKMTGLSEYTMDVRSQMVTMKGDIKFSPINSTRTEFPNKEMKDECCPPLKFLRIFRGCFSI